MSKRTKTEKTILRFTREYAGKGRVFGTEKKEWIETDIFRDIPRKHTRMTRYDVKSYFRSVKPSGLNKGEYCDRCGSLIGQKFRTRKPNSWRGFHLCNSCFRDKKEKKRESTPDLEDIKRFKVDIFN